MEVSIIVPAYNEERIIKDSVKKLNSFARKNKYDYEIIVVNDGSNDGTASIVRKMKEAKLVSYPINRGKGYAIKQGVMNSTKKNIVIIDADIPWELSLMNKLLDFDGNDISIGSRAISTSKTRKRPTFLRGLLGHTFSRITRILLGIRLRDTQSGFKAFKRDAAMKIFSKQTIYGWAFDVEILYLAKKYGFKVKEVAIDKVDRLSFRVSKLNPFKDPIKMFFSLAKIKLNDLRKKY